MKANVSIEKRGTVLVSGALRSRPVQVSAMVFGAAVLTAYWPALSFWWSRWFEHESYYSHGPFVIPACAYIVWFNRKRLGFIAARPSSWGLAIAAVAGIVGWLAWMGASASIMGFTLPLLLLGGIAAVFGFAAARVLAFPLALLYTAAALPESLLTAVSLKVQTASIAMATYGLNLLGTNAVSRGSFIDMPGLTIEVGGPCSGFRLLISMVAIAAFFAYIRRGPLWGRLSMVAFMLPLSLAVNSLRILIIAMAGLVWGRPALLVVHDWTGYLLLLVTAGMLLLFARLVGCARYRQMPLA